MIGVDGIGQHLAVENLVAQGFADRSIVDTPAFIIGSGSGPVTPPAIRHFIGVLVSERIHHARTKPPIHPGTFVGQKTSCIFVANGVVNVNGLVGNVVITHHDKVRSGFPQLLHVVVKIPQKCHFYALPDFATGAGGEVAVQQGQVIKVGAENTPLAVVHG